MNENKPIILASASPRRTEIMRQAGYEFIVRPSGVEDTIVARPDDPRGYAVGLATGKAEDIAGAVDTGLVIGADTIVVCDGEILNKPVDDADAVRMLTRLSGRAHEVITGLVVLDVEGGREVRRAVAHASTEVRLRPVATAEIAAYVATGEPRDKAGAYAIQGRAAVFIEGITGDYLNVVGLPLYTLSRILADLGRPPFRR